MASISVHVDDEVSIDPMTQTAIDGQYPLTISIESFCGEGPSRHTYQKDQVSLHGGVDAFRRFANAILAALPARAVEEAAKELKEAV